MSRSSDPVLAAIDRWRERGLVGEELAERLRADAAASAQERGRAQLQYTLGATAGLILLLAAGIFIARNWALLGVPLRCAILVGTGALLVAGARPLEARARLEPVGLLLRASGLALVLVAWLYSDEAWEAGTPGAFIVAALALLTPWLSVRLARGRRAGTAAVNSIAAYAFLAVFLDRLGLSGDGVVWVLDAVLLLSLVSLAIRLRAADPSSAVEATLVAFLVSLFGGLVLVWWTAVGPLGIEGSAIWPLDLWLLVIVAVLLWGIHRAPPRLWRPWYDRLLAGTVLIAMVFSFFSLEEVELRGRWMAVGPALVAAVGIPYGLRHSRAVALNACIALLAAAGALTRWGDRGPLSVVLVLGATAALLFGVATRLARGPA